MGWLELLFPARCAACGAVLPREAPLCDECHATLIPLHVPACRVCALPADLGPEGKCPACTADPPAFRQVTAPFAFAGAMLDAIPRFKYRDRPHLAGPLVDLGWAVLEPALQGVDLLAPVPLHPARLRERGYDQALLLANALGMRAGIPVASRLLRRTRATSAQVGASARARAENLRGAFHCGAGASGCVVGLIDDVVTTTSTAREAALALRVGGAVEVRVLALARAF